MVENAVSLPHFGLLLRDYLKYAGWSQSELARQLERRCGYKISSSTISKYVLGHRRPSGEFIAHLEVVFQLEEEEAAGFLQALSTDHLLMLIEQYGETKEIIRNDDD